MELIASSSVVSMAVGVLAIVVVVKLLSLPISLMLKFVSNSIVGALMLMVVNFVCVHVFNTPPLDITILKAFAVGLFGVPGVIVLIVIEKLL